MIYKPSPENWMEFLYGEMETEERDKMEHYLANNPEAEAEWKALELTQMDMQSIAVPQAPEPPQLLFPQKTKSLWYQNRWLHAVAAGIALMLSAKLIGVQMKFQDRVFSIQFGTPSVQEATQDLEKKIALLEIRNQELEQENRNDSLLQVLHKLGESVLRLEDQNLSLTQKVSAQNISESQLAALKADIRDANYQMVLTTLSKTQEYQQSYTENLLADFSQFLEKQRQQDLKLMELAFNHIIEQNDLQQEETKFLLTELITQLGD